jgi:mono/diheme cytochrome c family protein
MRKYLLAGVMAIFGLMARADDSTAPKMPSMLPPAASAGTSAGRALFLKNCAHCHGADAHGDDGPDLHDLDWTDEQIEKRIRNGKKGQMTSFEGKLTKEEIGSVIGYLRTLK